MKIIKPFSKRQVKKFLKSTKGNSSLKAGRMEKRLLIIGAGLAGCEAAWQAAQQGVGVRLFEMKPVRFSPAHKSPNLAELVCSNSLRSAQISSAIGLLKEELRLAGSLIMEAADATKVPAGKAHAVDRELFSRFITNRIESHPLIDVVRQEVTKIPDNDITIVATGPLSSEDIISHLKSIVGQGFLSFYDAIAPIVDAESINMDIVFRQSRYGPIGEGDYLNCPMDKKQYESFVQALLAGEKVPLKDFESAKYFEGCLPIEVMAERGPDTLRYGPMKPVGLTDPRTGKQPWAVVQLRAENRQETMFNLVGFQTKLKWNEQKRIFRMIPGLEEAEFVRLGSIHRNTFVCAPRVLNPDLTLQTLSSCYLAGQISGVEGYVESTAMGLLAGINAARKLRSKEPVIPPPVTAVGALISHLTEANPETFQPMNVNFGLFPRLTRKMPKRFRGEAYAKRALKAWHEFLDSLEQS